MGNRVRRVWCLFGLLWLCGCIKVNRRALHENAKTFAKEVCAGSAVAAVRERYAPEVVVAVTSVACRGGLAADGRLSSFESLTLLGIDGRDYVFVPSWGMLHAGSGRWLVVWQCDREFPSVVSFSPGVESCIEQMGKAGVPKREE